MSEFPPSAHLAEVLEPVVNGYEIPDQLEVTKGFGVGELAAKMGMLLVSFSPEHSIAVMPVAGNRQPVGLMHGGAYCVLGESLGSLAAKLHAGDGRVAMGIDINATHTGTATEGWVTGECRAIHLGGSVAVHEIVISDARGRRCSTVRITNMLRTRR